MTLGRIQAQTDLVRGSAELDQARVALETAQDKITALASERDALAQEVAEYREERRSRETAAIAPDSRLRAANTATKDSAAKTKELRTAIEEMQVLAEQLEATNEQLHQTNLELDRRVVERTAALDLADQALASANQDLVQRVDAETAARVASQARLFQSQKLEAIGQLTGGIAHDFNNLLTVITSGLQLLARAGEEERRTRLIGRIEEAAWRGADLTRRLLAFARRQPLNPQRLEIAGHVQGLRELLRHGLREDIRIRTAIPAGLWPVEADLAALELSLLNLAVNARDAMPNGGTMVLGGRNIGRDSGTPERLGLVAGDYVELFVTDTGTGMSGEVLARVFEPFFTTKSAGKGTGLGLAQVYGFAKQSGGTARVQSKAGEGTTLSLVLPRSTRSPELAEQPVPALRPHRVRASDHLSVLVVEDDDEVAAVVLDMFDQLGHRGLRVSSLAAAIAVLSGGESIDLIFSDVLLAGTGSGLDLAREVARRQLSIPVVLTSGYGGGVSGRLTAARLPFLRKPYTISALREVLSQSLQSEPVKNG